MKINRSIIFTFTVLFALFISIIGAYVNFESRKALINDADNLVKVTSEIKTQHVESYLESQKELVVMLGAASIFRDYLKESTSTVNYPVLKQKVVDRFERTLSGDKNINEVFIMKPNALVAVSSDPKHEGVDKSNDFFFTKGKLGPYLKDIYFSEVSKQRSWGLAAPIADEKTGELYGVVALRLNTDSLYKILQIKSSIGETGEEFLVNKNRTFITPSRFLGDSVILSKSINTENVTECFNKKDNSSAADHLDYRNVATIGAHSYIPEMEWCLITKFDKSEVYKPIYKVNAVFAISTIVGILLFILTGSLISNSITKPIEELQKGVEIIQKGNLEYKVGTNLKNEIGQLSRQFDVMTQSIKQSRTEIDKKVEEQTKEIVEKSTDLQKQQTAILNILDDAEKEKTRSEQLAADLQKFKLAVDSTEEHVVITDSNGIILYANSAVTKITGFEHSEIMGKKAGSRELWGGLMETTVYENFWQTIKTHKQSFTGEFKNKRKDGENYIAEANVTPILSDSGEVLFFVGIERNVTKAKEVDRMKTEFISLASHQLRTPLSAMKWFSEMLLNGDAGPLSTEQKEYVNNIYISNERMVALVNSLLNISRIESGRIIIDPEPTDLRLLVDDVIKELKNKIDEKHQTAILSTHPDLSKVNIDPKLIREVYKNLLTNAIKYTPDKGDITIFISKNEDQVISQVSDTGYGIPAKDKDRVFQKFYRGENVVKMETDGTGLGLYLVKSIVDSSKGKIWFESSENKGTTFWFTLPLKGVEAKEGEVRLNS